MTELQVTINNLKEVCIAAELVLEKLEKAQKDLESPHGWKHGDVFETRYGSPMICIDDMCNGRNSRIRVYCLTGPGCDCTHSSVVFLEKAKFLFNIKEKL